MTSIDRLHSRGPLRIAEGSKGTRINFPCEVWTPQKTRTVLVGWSDGLLPKYPDCRCSASSSQRTAAKLFGYLPKETLRTISSHESGYVLICRQVYRDLMTDLGRENRMLGRFRGVILETSGNRCSMRGLL
jgi:hypothetical protein